MQTQVIVRKPNVKAEEVEQIRQLSEQGHSDQELADTFGTWPKIIEQIRNGSFHRGGVRGPRGPHKPKTVPTAALKEIMESIFETRTKEIEAVKAEIEEKKRSLEVLLGNTDYIAAKNYLHDIAVKEAQS